MQLIDLESEEVVEKQETLSVKTEEWIKAPPTPPNLNETSKSQTNSDFGDLTKDANITELGLAVKAFQFTDSFTMHGVRYIFMKDISRMRRFIWTVIVLAGMSYCYYILYENFTSYYSYPTITRTKKVFEQKSKFPAITICSYNIFQKSKLSQEELLAVTTIFDSLGAFVSKPANLSDFDDLNVTKFYYEKAYDYDSSWCFYKSKSCNLTYFSKTLTDTGICATFDPSQHPEDQYQTAPGQSGGFYWAQIFDPSEWVVGPFFTYEGFRIAIHEPGTKEIFVQEVGISPLPGLISEIVIERHEINLLPPPHGECGTKQLQTSDKYTRSLCTLECHTNHTVAVCGCKFVHMPGPARVCRLSEINSCQALLKDERNITNLFDPSSCNCPQDCTITSYEVHDSYAYPSQGYIDILNAGYGFNIRETGVGLRVFYQDLEYTEMNQEAVYTFQKLMCDIGGAAGLFLGCSFVTFFEFFDFLVEFIWFWSARGALLRRTKREVTPII
ncbi:acid-sensing ion channel 2-like [Clavelina lepadiformis]|uniref:acid-sensing ion channel 2-like n=1 Tax=Clavelina lepadiformis TaxID=159417 RepID=UPI0040423A95